MKNEVKTDNSSQEEVKAGILELFDEHEEFKDQPEIMKALKAKGIKTSQAMVSRVLIGLGIERNENNMWAPSNKGGYRQNLETLGELFEKAGGSPRLYSDIEMVILRVEPNYNVLISQQIAKTFEYEVLSTFCPNDMDIIIYYRQRKKELPDAQEMSAKKIESEEGETQIQAAPKDQQYEKSRMRIEIVKLCKKMRNKNE